MSCCPILRSQRYPWRLMVRFCLGQHLLVPPGPLLLLEVARRLILAPPVFPFAPSYLLPRCLRFCPDVLRFLARHAAAHRPAETTLCCSGYALLMLRFFGYSLFHPPTPVFPFPFFDSGEAPFPLFGFWGAPPSPFLDHRERAFRPPKVPVICQKSQIKNKICSTHTPPIVF